MKIYISADMEGIANHTGWDMVRPGSALYPEAAQRMTREVAAAVEGAFAIGASEVHVNDSHNGMRNLVPELLDSRTILVSGAPKPWSMLQGVDDSFDMAFFVGYHAMGGGMGVLAHTYSLAPQDVRVNDVPLGEAGMNALVAGHFGVPIALVTGDDVLAAEVGKIMPWTERVVVKTAMNRFAASSLSPRLAQEAVREGAMRAIARRSEMKVFTIPAPYHLRVTFTYAGQADVASICPGAERVGARDVAIVAADPLLLHRAFRTLVTLAGVANE